MHLLRWQWIKSVWIYFCFFLQEVYCSSLPSPLNVTIVSINLEHKLTWTPGRGTGAFTHFRVQSYNQKRKLWNSVKSCSDLQIGESCDLTSSFKEPFALYQARVQAFNQDQESNWTTSKFFTPLTDTTLGPPFVSVTGCGNCLVLKLSPPASLARNRYPLTYIYGDYAVSVSRTRDKAQASDGETLINYLEPGVEYCITVTVVTSFKNLSLPSKPQCTYTSSQPLNTDEVPPPQNLRITSENLGLVLEWDPPQASAAKDFRYTAEFKSWSQYAPVCKTVSSLSCDFTQDLTPYGTYTLRVRTELDGNSSAWVELECKPLETITVIGAPDVRLQSRAGKLEVDITEPVLRKSSLKDVYTNVLYRIRYWTEGQKTEIKEKMVDQSRVMLTDLLSETRYCVKVELVMLYTETTSLPSNITCKMNTASDEVASWLIAVVLLVSFLVTLISALLIYLAVWGGYRGIRFLHPQAKIPEHFKQYLTERPGSTMLLAMQNSTQPKELCHQFSIITISTAQDQPPESKLKEHLEPT
ncbi:Interferon alpha/beta receptor 2 [Bagarius yarrelli]|uniref:Interferon alpha/beta receptor 2 n=1 Tax=Bagarius yarrelli TaxID=175774 RepID=A0A556U4L1_BAGYA|nr:Interferon alpha/beta receptor 2 [Bagarius yarrelli]